MICFTLLLDHRKQKFFVFRIVYFLCEDTGKADLNVLHDRNIIGKASGKLCKALISHCKLVGNDHAADHTSVQIRDIGRTAADPEKPASGQFLRNR